MIVTCQYCNKNAVLVDSSLVYGRSYGMIYLCSNYPKCDAYVGVHKGTDNPKGSLANRETREYRKWAHAAFDPLWKSGTFRRSFAYKCLCKVLCIKPSEAHIGSFDVEKCKLLIRKIDDIIKECNHGNTQMG